MSGAEPRADLALAGGAAARRAAALPRSASPLVPRNRHVWRGTTYGSLSTIVRDRPAETGASLLKPRIGRNARQRLRALSPAFLKRVRGEAALPSPAGAVCHVAADGWPAAIARVPRGRFIPNRELRKNLLTIR